MQPRHGEQKLTWAAGGVPVPQMSAVQALISEASAGRSTFEIQ